jgi:hypothetical protein
VKGSSEQGREEKSELMGNVHMSSVEKITRNYKQFFFWFTLCCIDCPLYIVVNCLGCVILSYLVCCGSCIECIVVIQCVIVVLCVCCCFYFRCRTAG